MSPEILITFRPSVFHNDTEKVLFLIIITFTEIRDIHKSS